MSTQPIERLTPEAYLALERAAEDRHEYVGGAMRLMSGASRRHNLIVVNLTRLIANQLATQPSEVYANDMRVKVSEDGRYTYPDLAIACDEPEFEDAELDTLLNPQAVIEVLSDSTAAYDRGEKFTAFRTIPSLREYVLVSQSRVQAEHFQRLDDGGWRFQPVEGPDDTLTLAIGGVRLPMAEVYSKVRFDDET